MAPFKDEDDLLIDVGEKREPRQPFGDSAFDRFRVADVAGEQKRKVAIAFFSGGPGGAKQGLPPICPHFRLPCNLPVLKVFYCRSRRRNICPRVWKPRLPPVPLLRKRMQYF